MGKIKDSNKLLQLACIGGMESNMLSAVLNFDETNFNDIIGNKSFFNENELYKFVRKYKEKIDIDKFIVLRYKLLLERQRERSESINDNENSRYFDEITAKMEKQGYAIIGEEYNDSSDIDSLNEQFYSKANSRLLQIMEENLRKSDNVVLYSLYLDEITGKIKIDRFSTYEVLGIRETKPVPKELEDNALVLKSLNLLKPSDLLKVIPRDLYRVIVNKEIYEMAQTKGKTVDEAKDWFESTNKESISQIAPYILKTVLEFKQDIKLENLFMISAYRGREFLQRSLEEKKEYTSEEAKKITEVYNTMVEVSRILEGMGNVKFKGSLLVEEAGEIPKEKRIVYTTKNLKYDLSHYRDNVLPSSLNVKGDLLQGLEEREIDLKGTFEKIRRGEDVVKPEDDVERDPLKVYKVGFISPEEKDKILQSSKETPIAYRGKTGKAYEGYAVYMYPQLKFAVVECFWKKDKTGEKRYPYSNSTVIVPMEQVDKVLASKKKLENVPTQKQYRRLHAQEGKRMIFFTNTKRENREKMEKGQRLNSRKPVRVKHDANWKKVMQNVVQGKLNPFEIIIVESKRRNKSGKDNSKTEINIKPR